MPQLYRIGMRGVERIPNQCHGPHPEQDSESEIARLKWAHQPRFLDSQNHQGDELQQQARSVEDEVDGDQPLEGAA